MTPFYEAVDIAAVCVVTSAFVAAFVYAPINMRRATRQSCIALTRAVESREPHMLGHSERTAEILTAMARRSLRFTPWQIRDLETAALLHIVGKVGVPFDLLNSQTPASGPRRAAVRDYVRIGAEIVGAVPALRNTSHIIEYHREYLDGEGYPHSCPASEIPFGSRLLCVASEFVAMTSPRIYRAESDTMSVNEALDYFAERAGTHYDPVAVDLLDHVCRPMPGQNSGVDFELAEIERANQ